MRTLQHNGNVIESGYTDTEALKRCWKRGDHFSRSLVFSHKRRGRLSLNQWYHAHRIANTAPRGEFESGLYDVLNPHFEHAESVRKRMPRLFFPSVGIDIYRAKKGAYVGCFQVCNGKSWRERQWYGVILHDRVKTGPECPRQVKAFLRGCTGFCDMVQREHEASGVCPLCNQARAVGRHCKRVWGL